jgi:transcriptional regulator with XRE-family HTH domain
VDLRQFGARLRELRIGANLTQQQLAEHAGVKRDAVARWENGIREPGWFNVVALAEALGVDCRAFLEEPARRPQIGRGRPPKSAGEKSSPAAPKKQGQPHRGTKRANS